MAVVAAACAEDPAPLPPTPIDAAVVADASTPPEDASAPDATPLLDASAPPPVDAGFVDAGHLDAATADVGSSTITHSPVVFIHGVNGSATEYDVMMQRLVDDGWPRDRLHALQFDDPRWGCNMDNAETIEMEVQRILQESGAARIDLVAHSMGTLSSRWFVKFLGGEQVVDTYVTIGGMHHGLRTSCLSPLRVCVWREICTRNEMVTMLDAAPATPGDLHWVSIYSTADDRVPNWSSELDGAENIVFDDIPHAGADGLLENPDVIEEVERVLQYPAW